MTTYYLTPFCVSTIYSLVSFEFSFQEVECVLSVTNDARVVNLDRCVINGQGSTCKETKARNFWYKSQSEKFFVGVMYSQ